MDFLNTPEAQAFLKQHANADVRQLALKAQGTAHLPELLNQIKCRQKAKSKLPTWFANEKVIYPAELSLQQCSSEEAAKFKASLVEGEVLIDLTGGFGVDDYFFAQHFKTVHHIEMQEDLSARAKNNFSVLGAKNIQCHATTAEAFLQDFQGKADCIYIDPHRRDEAGRKVFRWEDCLPDVTVLMDRLFEISSKVLIKASPMIDIKQGARALRYLSEVIVLGVDNECKEVLYLLDAKKEGAGLNYRTVNLSKGHAENFSFSERGEETTEIPLSRPEQFIYEPNVAILKAGGYRSLASFGVKKLGRNTHLYTSETLVENFPGRKFRLLKVCKYAKKEVVKAVGVKQANITVRNFPNSVAEIRKKLGLKDGGDKYLFAISDKDDKLVVLICEQLFFP